MLKKCFEKLYALAQTNKNELIFRIVVKNNPTFSLEPHVHPSIAS